MKKTALTIAFFLAALLPAQMKMKDYNNILKSRNIYEINAFLRDAHPDDPRRSVLKPKVMKMMREYIMNAHPADQRVKEMQEMLALLKRRPSTKISFDEMNEIIKQKQIAKYRQEMEAADRDIANNSKESSSYLSAAANAATYSMGSANAGYADPEAEEFALLINQTPTEHKMKTTQILNSLFDNDPTSKESIVMIENKSDCNIIMRIEGVGRTKYRLAIPAQNENTIVVEKGNYLFTSLVCGADYASQKTVEKSVLVSLGNPVALSSTNK